jgi:hypothetical protein
MGKVQQKHFRLKGSRPSGSARVVECLGPGAEWAGDGTGGVSGAGGPGIAPAP